MAEATVTSKGQVTIPKRIRDALEIRTGDRLSFTIRDDGSVQLLVISGDLRELGGMLKATRRVSLDDMDEAIAGGATNS